MDKECERLNGAMDRAMRGLRTDDKAIIEILTNKSDEQRKELSAKYKELYQEDLLDSLERATAGNFRKVICGLLKSPAQVNAGYVKDALEGFRVDYEALIGVICVLNNEEIKALKEAYHEEFGKKLEEHVRSRTSGDVGTMLVSLLQANRSESTEVDEGQAKTDAQELKNVFYATFGGDKSVPITIFVNRSYDQLRATFNEYATLTNSTILADIESKLSGNLAKAFLTIGSLVIDDVKYYAKTLYDSMKGLGTRDAILMFVVTRTYRTKMKEIKPAYLKEYGETLTSWIEDDTSGAYKRSLLALVGPEGGEEAPAESTDQAANPETQDQGQEQATEQAAEAPAEEPPAEATEQAAE